MDPITLTLLISAIVGTVASGAVGVANAINSSNAQKAANKANIELFKQEMDYNSAEAQKNRDFQLMMSNTAHQREVKDLKAAGLNPWLSVSGSGSPVVSSSSASTSSPSVKSEAPNLSELASALSSVKDIALISALSSKYSKK